MEQAVTTQTLFSSKFINFDAIFNNIFLFLEKVFYFIINPHLWTVIGFISIVFSIVFMAIGIFSLVRLIEMQIEESVELDEEIKEAIRKEKEYNEKEHPQWANIMSLSESMNESDWRMAIIEADIMLEDALKSKDIEGDTVGELLESARDYGYAYIQDVWNAHTVRNKIAHEGPQFPVSKVETNRTLKMYQNFFEELEVI